MRLSGYPAAVAFGVAVTFVALTFSVGTALAQTDEAASKPAATRPAATRPAGPDMEAYSERADTLRRISDRLICQCGCSMVLAECSHQNCPFALPERAKILAEIDAGKTDDEIVEGYVADYGRSILSTPPTDGSLLDLLAWVLPALALGVGLVIVARVVIDLARPRGNAPEESAKTDDPFLARAREELSRSREDDKK